MVIHKKGSLYFHHNHHVTTCKLEHGKRTSAILFRPIMNVKTIKKPKKYKFRKKGKHEIPIHNQFDYSDILAEFNETKKLTEAELDALLCFSEYKWESDLNRFNDKCLNDHLCSVFSTKRQETISFMQTCTSFFVHQYRTKLTLRVQSYLDSKKLSLDEWLMSVKHRCRGDIMLVYILSIMKGLLICIHLKNGKIWSTLHVVLIHHAKMMSRCDIHMVYFSFGIFLRLVL